jgi:hypothetical protein
LVDRPPKEIRIQRAIRVEQVCACRDQVRPPIAVGEQSLDSGMRRLGERDGNAIEYDVHFWSLESEQR